MSKKNKKVEDIAVVICGVILLACASSLAIVGTIKAITLMFGF